MRQKFRQYKKLYIKKKQLHGSTINIAKKFLKKIKQDGISNAINLSSYYIGKHQVDIKNIGKSENYKNWIIQNEKNIFDIEDLNFNPLVSIITPTYNTEKNCLIKMLNSVISQTYTNWELCIADDASTIKETIAILEDYEKKYTNIKVIYRKENGHISKASNKALELATGEYVVLLDHDDMLSPNALYEMVKMLNENKTLKLIYSDEDKIDYDDNRYDPHFKSSWNPDMFYSQNYICHLVLLKKEIIDSIGGFRVGYEGSQDYDIFIRYIDKIEDKDISHISKVLYHWRAIEGSTALNQSEKNYSHNAGLKALEDYFLKKDLDITVEDGLLPNTYKVNYPIINNPLVSIIIPTKDQYTLLEKCISSILKKTTYKNYEIIIVDNETTCKKTLLYFEKLKKYKNIQILEYHKPFNYSAINNYAVSRVKGEYIALLNNDIEIISENWLKEMLSQAIRKDIGVVGAKLYYDDMSIQHAGVVLGIAGVAGHSHKYFLQNSNGYFSRLKIIQNYSALTAACIVVKKSIFEDVGALEEEHLTVAFNDVDFCLKVQQKGYRNIFTPYAQAFHYESKSRGAEDNPQKVARFNSEVEYMKKKWDTEHYKDPYYSKNLTLYFEDFRLNV